MSELVLFGQLVLASLLATVLHEGAHAVAAMALGKYHAFDIREWQVIWRFDGTDQATFGDWCVAGAPLGIGLLALPVVIMSAGWPPLWFWFGWGWFTLIGALAGDFQFQTVRTTAGKTRV